ncbi:M28 family metallopeptidase [Marinicella sp. W31]|uniref:M28 family metallopeptidase n=1 Tax=Marinicella sp. W31 TaxID=3023713 RepID=UPI0037566CB8
MYRMILCVSLIVASQALFARLPCILTQESIEFQATVQMIPFATHNLYCGTTVEGKKSEGLSFLAEQSRIIRGNLVELSEYDVEVLHHAHGYSLVTGDFNGIQDKHLHAIKVTDFKGINKPESVKSRGANPLIQTLVDQIDAGRWLNDVTTLSSWSRRTGEVGNVNAANWISTQMNGFGLSVTMPSFDVNGTSTNNILGVQVGTTRPNDWYLVGAHMDSVPSGNAPGALDNASGCSGVLELARIASQYSFEGTLLFICFSGEEQGLIGSEFHVDTLMMNNDQNKIKVALTMDMIGYSANAQRELLVESSVSLQWLLDTLVQNAATYASGLTVFTSNNYFGSDHVPYIDNGMPGVLSIDDDWGVYPHYHRSSDLPEALNNTQNQAEMILKTNLATLAMMAGIIDTSDVIFADGFE